MVIAFTGSHSTGKSSIVEAFKGKTGIVCLNSCTRSTITAEERRVDGIDDLNTSQLNILKAIEIKVQEIKKLSEENPNTIYLMDRCIFDFIAYSKSFYKKGLLSKSVLEFIEKRAKDLYSFIDLIVYVPIEFDIVDDGVRSLDNNLRKAVDKEIQNQILNVKAPTLVTTLRGSEDERIRSIQKIIDRWS